MATANLDTITALRETARRLEKQSVYQWGHMGACNCGNLAQVLTPFSKAEIHRYAIATREGDWNDMLDAYCENSGLPMDMMISAIINKGFSVDDLKNLEYLSDEQVLERTKSHKAVLRHNSKEDVILYLNEWANLLEEQMLNEVNIPQLFNSNQLALVE